MMVGSGGGVGHDDAAAVLLQQKRADPVIRQPDRA
jgi:hypothetical protein